MIQLSLRPTVIAGETGQNDYRVMFEGRRVGRIREATEQLGFNPCWTWAINPPLPIPTWGSGQATSLEGAKPARQCRRCRPKMPPARAGALKEKPAGSNRLAEFAWGSDRLLKRRVDRGKLIVE